MEISYLYENFLGSRIYSCLISYKSNYFLIWFLSFWKSVQAIELYLLFNVQFTGSFSGEAPLSLLVVLIVKGLWWVCVDARVFTSAKRETKKRKEGSYLQLIYVHPNGFKVKSMLKCQRIQGIWYYSLYPSLSQQRRSKEIQVWVKIDVHGLHNWRPKYNAVTVIL